MRSLRNISVFIAAEQLKTRNAPITNLNPYLESEEKFKDAINYIEQVSILIRNKKLEPSEIKTFNTFLTTLDSIQSNIDKMAQAESLSLTDLRDELEEITCQTNQVKQDLDTNYITKDHKLQISEKIKEKLKQAKSDIFKSNLESVQNLIDTHTFELHKLYGKEKKSTAANQISKIIAASLASPALMDDITYNAKVAEITNKLRGKLKSTIGLFGIGSRDESTVRLYKEILLKCGVDLECAQLKLEKNPLDIECQFIGISLH
jgi:hypothetical protein